MIKAVLILKSGCEITVKTETLDVKRDRRGNVTKVEIDDPERFIRYLNPREIACALAYSGDAQEKEEQANG